MKPALAVLLICSLRIAAQTVTGTLEGRITDPSGGVVAGAEVTAKNSDTGLTRVTKTNNPGYFQITFLPVGSYDVTARAPGFGAIERTAQVELSSARQVDFELKPASVDTAVTVTAESPLIDTSRGDLKSTIDEKTIEDRPLSSRNILALVEQLPGFQSTGGYSGVNNPTLSSGSYVSFNGAGSRSVAFPDRRFCATG
jgi:Carboxypeptidase regulatory-like domain